MNENDWQRFDQKLDELTSDIRTIKRFVVGDSDPEHSLMYRVADHTRQLEDIKAQKKNLAALAWTAAGTGVTAVAMWTWTKLTGTHP